MQSTIFRVRSVLGEFCPKRSCQSHDSLDSRIVLIIRLSTKAIPRNVSSVKPTMILTKSVLSKNCSKPTNERPTNGWRLLFPHKTYTSGYLRAIFLWRGLPIPHICPPVAHRRRSKTRRASYSAEYLMRFRQTGLSADRKRLKRIEWHLLSPLPTFPDL